MYTPVINCNLVQDKPAELSIMNAPEIEIYQTKVLLIKLDIPVSSWVVGEGIKEFSGFSVHPTEVTATLIKYRVDIDLETALDIDLETALDIDLETALDQVNNTGDYTVRMLPTALFGSW